MVNNVIQIGNKIEMRAVERRMQTVDTMEDEVYISQFLQWSDKDSAQIAVPIYKGRLLALRVDDVYELRFYTKGGLYRCRAKILKRTKEEGSAVVAEIKLVSALEKYQRRQYYRMNCIIPMTYAVLTETQLELYREKKRCLTQEQKQAVERKLEMQNIELKKATVLDISGGGVRFNSSIQQEAGDILLLQPSLPESIRKKVPFLFGRIISSRKLLNSAQEIFDNRIEFVEITHSEQEELITYIFKEERDKRKREADFK